MDAVEIRTAPSGLLAVLESMRVSHWVKNAFVAAPILFAHKWSDPFAWAACVAAVVAFCLVSSAVYLINDVADRSSDRAHPTKCNRPVASGRLSPTAAIIAAAVLFLLGMGTVVGVDLFNHKAFTSVSSVQLVACTVAYCVLNLLYSFWLKHHWGIDVITVALGFVLRAMAGAAAIAAPISPWLVVCTFTLCLFIALAKRRSEVTELSTEQAAVTRKTNRHYDVRDLEHMLTVSTGLAILTYTLYCLAPRTILAMHSANMVWTIPLVVYGMFRYNRLTRIAGRNDPVKVLLHDKGLWAVLLAYVLLTGLVVTYGPLWTVLDVEIVPK